MKIYQKTPTIDTFTDNKSFRHISDSETYEITNKCLLVSGVDYSLMKEDWKLDKIYGQTRAIHVIGLYYLLGIVIGIATSVWNFSNTFHTPWVRDFFETEDFYLLFAETTFENMKKINTEEIIIDDSNPKVVKTQLDDETLFSMANSDNFSEIFTNSEPEKIITLLAKAKNDKISDECFLKCYRYATGSIYGKLGYFFFKDTIVRRPIIYSLLTDEKKATKINFVMSCIADYKNEIVKYLDKELLEDLDFLKRLTNGIRNFSGQDDVQGWLLNRFFDLDIKMPYTLLESSDFDIEISYKLYPNKTKNDWGLNKYEEI